MEQNELLICTCHDVEHQVIFSYDDDEICPEVYMSIHLSKLPFWKRVEYAVKYVFGYRSRYGGFAEIILKPEDASKMKKVYEYLKKLK